MKYKSLILILFVLILSSFVSGIDISDTNTKVYYNFDNINYSSPIIQDLTPNNYDGTNFNSVSTGVTGILNQAFTYDGINQYTSLGDVDIGGDHSINIWVKFTDDTDNWIVGKAGTTGKYPLELRVGPAVGLYCIIYDGTTAIGALENHESDYDDDQWHMVTCVRDAIGNRLGLYVDGISITNTTDTLVDDLTNNNNYNLGRRPTGANYYAGSLDEFSLWGKDLNQSEITYLYNSGSPKKSQQYPFISGVNIFKITSNSNFNNLSINSFSALINGSIYSTTNGTIYTDILDNSSNLYNITIYGINNYFNKTYFNYNVSSNLQAYVSQFPFINLYDTWNNNNITNYTIEINNINYTELNNPAYLELNNTYEAKIYANNYITQTQNLTLTENNNESAYLYQSIINISVYRNFDLQQVSNYTITIQGTNYTTSTQNIIINPSSTNYTVTNIYDNTGIETYTLINNSFEVLPLDNKNVILTVAGHKINIFVKNIINNDTINNFTTTISGLNFTDERTNITTSGIATFNVNDGSFNITVDAQELSLINNTIILEVNNSKEIWNYTFYIYPTNSINFTFYDESFPLSLFTGNISFDLINGGASSYNTSTGYYFFQDLTVDDYEIKYTSNGYDDRSYFFTVTNRSTQKISLYLSNSSNTESYIIRVADLSDVDVVGAVVKLQKQIIGMNGQYVTIEECVTDEDGQCDMYIQESSSINYKFIVLINDEIIKITEPQNIINIPSENKIIVLRVDIGDSIFEAWNDIKNIYNSLTVSNNITTWQVVDSGNMISGVCLNIERSNLRNSTRTELYNNCEALTSATISKSISSYLINNTILYINGQIYYNDFEPQTIKTLEIKTDVSKGANQDDNTELFTLTFMFIFVSFLTILIPNMLIQTFINFGILFIGDLFGLGGLSKVLIINFLVLGIIINWNKRNTSVTGL